MQSQWKTIGNIFQILVAGVRGRKTLGEKDLALKIAIFQDNFKMMHKVVGKKPV